MRHLFFVLCLCVAHTMFAQEYDLPAIHFRDMITDYVSVDSSAEAVAIKEIGKTELEPVEADRALRVVHYYTVRIKILKKEGANRANFTIPLYAFGKDFEYIRDIEGVTHNLENNKIVSTPLTSKAIFLEKTSPYLQLSKFTLPNVREGSVIDIKYRIYSPDILNFRTWRFQSDIPKISSVYTAIMPATYQYRVILRGPYQLTDTKSEILRSHFLLNGVRNDCSKITYSMDSIPAFIEEDYMLAPKNYISAVYFELEQFYSTNGGKTQITKEWKDVDRELLTDRSFGGQIKRESVFKEIIPSVTVQKETDLDKAKAIYAFIKKNIKWNRVYGKQAQHGVKESLEGHIGNIGDINLSLIAALNSGGIKTYPVLVSTRENGLPNDLHPVISDFNYVIAAAEIDGKNYLLDASEANIPFGEIPLRCVNDRGRIIYSRKSSEWIPLKNEQASMINFSFIGDIDEEFNLKGKLTISYKGLEAMRKRNEISSFSSAEEYFEKMNDKTFSFDIENPTVENLNNLDEFLYERMDIQLSLSDYVQHGKFRFNPIFISRTTKNPFNLSERLYPVDLGAQRHVTHTVSVQLPPGFTLESAVKDANLKLPGDAARYSYMHEFEDNRLTMKQTVLLNKAIYSSDEYFYLKEFFSRIIKQQEQEFIFNAKP